MSSSAQCRVPFRQMTSFRLVSLARRSGRCGGGRRPWRDERATDSLLPGRALVLSPHQDDETIGCGLLMAEKSRRGIPVAVVVATDGRAGWYSSSTEADPARHRRDPPTVNGIGPSTSLGVPRSGSLRAQVSRR